MAIEKTEKTREFQTDDLKHASTGDSPVRIYWDRQDSQDEGPAWRSDEGSGRLDCIGWSDGSDCGDGRNLYDYFGADDYYLGPDCDGVYPMLE